MKEESKTPPPGVPPVESDAKFLERQDQALGGKATTPAMFRQIGKGKARDDGKKGSKAKPGQPREKRPHDAAFDGPRPELAASRQLVASLAAPMATLRGAIENSLPAAQKLVEAINGNPLAVKEAEAQGIDLKKVAAYLDKLTKAKI